MTRQFIKEKASAKGQKNTHEEMLSSSSSLDECKLKQGDTIFHLSYWQKLIGLITSSCRRKWGKVGRDLRK